MARTDSLILHTDDDVLVVNKPPRMLTTPVKGQTALSLEEVLNEDGHGVLAVHRLDRDTTGVVVFARSKGAKARLEKLFRTQRVLKSYKALAQGWLTPEKGEVTFPIKDLGPSACISQSGKTARTIYSTRRHVGPCSLLDIDISTGRHNQIRLHFAHIGHPLVGERKYALGKWALIPHRRVLLHASRLEIPRGGDLENLVITSPLPDDFQKGLDVAAKTVCTEDPGNMSPEGLFTTERRSRRR